MTPDIDLDADARIARTWVIIRDPGCVPERKGPIAQDKLASFLREAFAARPCSLVEVATVDEYGRLDVQDGPECLSMLDGRSRGVALAHIKRLRSARTDAATVARLQQENADLAGEIVTERAAIEAELRRYAGFYEAGSDGRNTFVVAADWVAARSAARLADPKRTNDKPDVSKKAGIVDRSCADRSANTERSDADGR